MKPLPMMMLIPALALCTAAAGFAETADPTRAILQRFADDYALDPSLLTPRDFCIRVGERTWQVAARPAGDGQPASVTLAEGLPATPTWCFVAADEAALARVDRGEVNALTSMGKARASDEAPMDIDVMEGYQPGPGFVTEALDTAFHFWTRGLPERVPFGGELTRTVHGAQAVVLYYQPGFRSAWFQIRSGQHANADPDDQSNPFPSLFVATHGRAKARVGGREIDVVANEAIFLPAGTAHEFWNPYDEPAEGILLMFGDGA